MRLFEGYMLLAADRPDMAEHLAVTFRAAEEAKIVALSGLTMFAKDR